MYLTTMFQCVNVRYANDIKDCWNTWDLLFCLSFFPFHDWYVWCVCQQAPIPLCYSSLPLVRSSSLLLHLHRAFGHKLHNTQRSDGDTEERFNECVGENVQIVQKLHIINDIWFKYLVQNASSAKVMNKVIAREAIHPQIITHRSIEYCS